jgi:hypothetical protein
MSSAPEDYNDMPGLEQIPTAHGETTTPLEEAPALSDSVSSLERSFAPKDSDDMPSLDQWAAMQENYSAMTDPVTPSLNDPGAPPLQILTHCSAPMFDLQIEELLSLSTHTGITQEILNSMPPPPSAFSTLLQDSNAGVPPPGSFSNAAPYQQPALPMQDIVFSMSNGDIDAAADPWFAIHEAYQQGPQLGDFTPLNPLDMPADFFANMAQTLANSYAINTFSLPVAIDNPFPVVHSSESAGSPFWEGIAPTQQSLDAAIQAWTIAAQASIAGEPVPEIAAHLWPNGYVPPLPPIGASNLNAQFAAMFEMLVGWVGNLSPAVTATMPIPVFYSSADMGVVPQSSVHFRRPRFDAVAFVNTLEQVNVADIPAEDMRCPHCWLPFGTTDEDDPAFVLTPDPDIPRELATRQIAFRELPHCADRADNDPVCTPCGHLFGRGCLIEAMEKLDTLCPTCRQELCPRPEIPNIMD